LKTLILLILTTTTTTTTTTGVRGRNSDNTLIREKLGWEPSIPISVGLREVRRRRRRRKGRRRRRI